MELNEQFEALVNKGVSKALAPHKDAILALAKLLGGEEPYNQEKCPEAPRAKRKTTEPRVVKGAVEAAEAFSVGQKVRYRQGRGEFEATVEAINHGTGELALKRIADGKIVKRPATKVSA